MKPLTAAEIAAYEKATTQYERDYENDEEARHYLEEVRGLGFATIGRLRLGVVRNPIDASHDRFTGSIHIPNIGGASDSHVVGSKFRSITEKRYDQPDGQAARLYNLQALNYIDDTIWICEGEFDAMSLEDIGLPAIAVPGASHWGKAHLYRNRLVEGMRVVLMRDSDDAALALIKAMAEIDGLVVRDCLPHKDVNEFLNERGARALYARATGADAR